jgi:hypothetical protein
VAGGVDDCEGDEDWSCENKGDVPHTRTRAVKAARSGQAILREFCLKVLFVHRLNMSEPRKPLC